MAGKLSALMSVAADVVDNPVLSLPFHANILNQVGIGSFATGFLLICLVPCLKYGWAM